jgi:hypothetical protein
MTERKHVPQTLRDLPNSELFQRILDPGDDCLDLIDQLIRHWSYDLYERRPRPALLENGALQPTDLDLACFLSALVDRKAVIILPTYKSRRAPTKREGEIVVDKNNRHGHVLGLTANKEVFSFSIRMHDVNVIGKDADGNDYVGAFRNFMLVDLDGDWYDGWKSIRFMPSRSENDFLNNNSLWTGNTVYFKNFVHPNRWVSLYGQWYMLTKVLVARLRAENSARIAEVKAKQAAGLKFPEKGEGARTVWPESEEGPSKPEKVPAFEAEVDADIPTDFPPFPETQAGLIACQARQTLLQYNLTPMLSFAVRATELAFAKKANSFSVLPTRQDEEEDEERIANPPPEPFPSSIRGAKWEHGYKIKRTKWNRLVLHQELPFMKGFAIRYRVKRKTERVAI